MDENLEGFKSITVELKADNPGTVIAEIATLGEVDHEGDYTEPGFFGTQAVKMMWNHEQAFNPGGAIPIGKGQISDGGLKVGDAVPFAGLFNLEIPKGREAYESVKFDHENPPPTQEWSYGYRLYPDGYKFGTVSTHNGKVRILQPRGDGSPGARVYEVSPTAIPAAGRSTRTVSVKSGMRFADQAEAVLAAVSDFVERADSLMRLRADDGRQLSDDHLKRLQSLAENLKTASDTIERMLHEGDETDVEMMAEFLRYQKIEAALRGVGV